MKGSVKWISIILIVGILAYFIYPKVSSFIFSDETTDQGQAAESASQSSLPVSAVIIRPQKIDDKINVTGSVMANESVEVRSEISGKIIKIHFAEGSRVKKGDLLLSIDDDELSAQLERLKHQKQLLEQSENRNRQLLEKEAISQEEYDVSLTELRTAEADLKLVSAQVAKTKIRAPFNGIVGLRHVSEGSYITPSTSITNIFSINPAKIDFSIPGKYSSRVNKGDKIRFMTEATKDFHEADIYAIEPQIDPVTRTLSLRAICDNDDGVLLPGQFAKIELIFNSYDNAIMVPTEAVIPELGGYKVFVNKGGQAESKKVETGLRTDVNIEITSGLSPNDTLITSGMLQLSPGTKVNLSIKN